jgi:small-conductance mechanosensitive channel
MRHLRAVLAAALCVALASPAPAQVRAAAAASAGVPAVPVALALPVAAPLSVPAALAAPLTAAPLPSVTAAPLPSVTAAPSVSVAPEAVPEAAAAPAVPAAEAAPAPAAPAAARASASLVSVAARRPASPGRTRGASARALWERFWSGAAARADAAAPVAAGTAAPAPAASRLSRAAPRRLAAGALAAPLAVPLAHLHAAAASALPFVEGGAVLVGTYFASRFARRLIDRVAARRGLDRQKTAAARLVASVGLWTAAVAGAMLAAGASPAALAAVFGAGGTIVTLGLRDVIGNAIQGVNFLLTRPFAIGDRVSIGGETGTVSDVTGMRVVLSRDAGGEVKIRHATLAATTVVLLGEYLPSEQRRLPGAVRPRVSGLVRSVWGSLDRRFWLGAVAVAGLAAVPLAAGPLTAWLGAHATGLALKAAGDLFGGALGFLTWRAAAVLGRAVDALAQRNAWRPETRTAVRLAAQAAAWAVGGGAALRALGASWTMLGASLGVTTLGIGLASNNFFGAVVQGAQILFTKPFRIGDRVKVGDAEGVVEDMTLYHVVVKLDEGRHALVPYAVVRDAVLVVNPGTETK